MKTPRGVTSMVSTAALVALCAVAAEKTAPLPRGIPPYGPLQPVSAPHVKQRKLDNGLTVWLVATPGFPKVAFSIAVRGGYAADAKDRPGMADLIAEGRRNGWAKIFSCASDGGSGRGRGESD